MMTSWDFRGTGSWTRLMQTLVYSGNKMRKVMTHEWTRQVVLLHDTFHKAVVKKILPLTDPPMYMCVHSTTSRYSGQVQAVLETEIVPGGGTYKFFKRNREGLTQLAQDLSQSCHAARSAARKRGAETKKVLKAMCTVAEESV